MHRVGLFGRRSHAAGETARRRRHLNADSGWALTTLTGLLRPRFASTSRAILVVDGAVAHLRRRRGLGRQAVEELGRFGDELLHPLIDDVSSCSVTSTARILRISPYSEAHSTLRSISVGLLLRQLGDLGRIVEVGEEKLCVELGFQPGPVHVRALRDQVVEHDQEAAVERVEVLAARGAARQPALRDLFVAVGPEITAASSLPARKFVVMTSMFWLR